MDEKSPLQKLIEVVPKTIEYLRSQLAFPTRRKTFISSVALLLLVMVPIVFLPLVFRPALDDLGRAVARGLGLEPSEPTLTAIRLLDHPTTVRKHAQEFAPWQVRSLWMITLANTTKEPVSITGWRVTIKPTGAAGTTVYDGIQGGLFADRQLTADRLPITIPPGHISQMYAEVWIRIDPDVAAIADVAWKEFERQQRMANMQALELHFAGNGKDFFGNSFTTVPARALKIADQDNMVPARVTLYGTKKAAAIIGAAAALVQDPKSGSPPLSNPQIRLQLLRPSAAPLELTSSWYDYNDLNIAVVHTDGSVLAVVHPSREPEKRAISLNPRIER